MNIILDRVAVWLPQNVDGLLVRKAPPATAYLTKDSLVFKSATQPLYRYTKNYRLGKTKYSLFVRTFDEDEKKVEKELDTIAKNFTADFVKSELKSDSFESFNYTKYYLTESEA